MALALDGSTPAVTTKTAASGTSQTITTASFTPPANSVLAIVLCTNSNGNSDALSAWALTDSLASHLTYTSFASQGNSKSDAQVHCWWATVASSQAMTITGSYVCGSNNASPIMLRVLVFTGADTSAPIGATSGARGLTTNVSATYSSTVDGSWGWLAYADWSQSGVPTVPAGETVDCSDNVSGEDTYAVIKQNSTTATAGTSVTMSTSTPSSGLQVSYAYFEIVPPAGSGGGSTNHFLSLLGCGS